MILSTLAQTNKLTHPFSVSSSQTVLFSQGNVIVEKSTGEVHFASKQTIRIGEDNVENIRSKSGGNDLLVGIPLHGHKQVFAPLGTEWRTLTAAEWDYLLNERNTKSGARYVKVYVYNILGMLIFPDDFECPSNVIFNVDNINTKSPVVIQRLGSEWNTIENLGVVFLPAAGYIQISDFGLYFRKGYIDGDYEYYCDGYYWIDDKNLFSFSAKSQYVDGSTSEKLCCYRLVKNDSSAPLSKKSSDYHSWGKGLSAYLKPADFSNNKLEGTYLFYIDEDIISITLEKDQKIKIDVNGENKTLGHWNVSHERGYNVYLRCMNPLSFYDENHVEVPMVYMGFRDGYIDVLRYDDNDNKRVYSFELYKVE